MMTQIFFSNVMGAIGLKSIAINIIAIISPLRLSFCASKAFEIEIRTYTGTGITLATFIWGAIFWLFSLFITYQLWGLLGVIAGIMFFGLGVFATAFLALIFDGQASGAFLILLNLIVIYGIRMLGNWIASKQK